MSFVQLVRLIVVAVVCVAVTGCSQLEFGFEKLGASSEPVGKQPALVLASKSEQLELFDSVLRSGKKKGKKTGKFQGVDDQRALIACIWLSEQSAPKPVIYVPTTDYEEFLDGLHKKFPMNRAIASRIRSGGREYVVTQGDRYAKISTSLEAAKESANAPGYIVRGLPLEDDVVIQWNPESAKRSHAAKLLDSLEQSFGGLLDGVLNLDDSVVLSFDRGPTSKIRFQIQNPDQDVDQVRESLAENFTVSKVSRNDLGLACFKLRRPTASQPRCSGRYTMLPQRFFEPISLHWPNAPIATSVSATNRRWEDSVPLTSAKQL